MDDRDVWQVRVGEIYAAAADDDDEDAVFCVSKLAYVFKG